MEESRIEQRNAAFSAREDDLSKRLREKSLLSDRISNLRLVLFVTAVVAAIGTASLSLSVPAYLLSAVLFIGFCIAALYHAGVKREVLYVTTLLAVHHEYQARLVHNYAELPDDGSDFVNLQHDFSGDLDLFGPRSLFHLMSVAKTWFGRRELAGYLCAAENIDLKRQDILDRQQAVREMSNNLALAQELQAMARMSRRSSEDPRRLIDYTGGIDKGKPAVRRSWLVISIINSTALLISSLLVWVFGVFPVLVPAIFVVIQLVLIAVKFQRFKTILASVDDYQEQLSSYGGLFAAVENAKVDSDLLRTAQQTLTSEGAQRASSASICVQRLHRILLFIQARSQPLLFFLLNVLFQYDVYCVYALESWKRNQGFRLEAYLHALAEWEGISSLSTLTHVYPEGVYPDFGEEKDDPSDNAFFFAEGMGHPLIPEKDKVRNQFSLPGGIALITGSNMSGKTTLLRTVGINAVLAYSGTVCDASEIRLGIMRIGSSMRIADDLGEGVSTFYAELLRIEKIIAKSREGGALLFLIDEIFRGTNSRDRTDGAKIVLDNLSRPYIIGLMSTHDYELCSEENRKGLPIITYHFSEYYDQDGIHFNYKLTDGVSTSTNARFLMRLIGIE